MNFGRWMLNILVAIDQLINTILRGDPDETISSRAAKGLIRIQRGDGKPGDWKWKLLCDILHIFDKNHCLEVIELDEGKRFTSA